MKQMMNTGNGEERAICRFMNGFVDKTSDFLDHPCHPDPSTSTRK